LGLLVLVVGIALVATSLCALVNPQEAGLSNDSNPYATLSGYFVMGYLAIGALLLWFGAKIMVPRFRQ
jgi:hypothetical protein